jgi:hypothetical protein
VGIRTVDQCIESIVEKQGYLEDVLRIISARTQMLIDKGLEKGLFTEEELKVYFKKMINEPEE